MNYGLILAGGVGQRMRNTGTPKQFLEVYRKPIIIYTLEQFEKCADIDQVVVVCAAGWLEHMNDLLLKYKITKVTSVVLGGKTRQDSIRKGAFALRDMGASEEDVIVIHDGVRPLVKCGVISENVRIAELEGCAVTVSPVHESIVVSDGDKAAYQDFLNREHTYTLTSPQTVRFELLEKTMNEMDAENAVTPLIDMAIAYASLNHEVYFVKDSSRNIKITTAEDFYILKALIELEENREVFGL